MSVLVISYSRSDQRQVRAVVSLLKSALRDVEEAVYWDGDFEAGDQWFDKMARHLETTPQLFVFWCRHAAASPQVRREFMYAFERKKSVVPVLMDNSPLSAELAPLHGIDLRQAINHGPLAYFPFARYHPLQYVLAFGLTMLFLVLGIRESRRSEVILPPPDIVVPPLATTGSEPPLEITLIPDAASPNLTLDQRSQLTDASIPDVALVRIVVHTRRLRPTPSDPIERLLPAVQQYLVEDLRIPPADVIVDRVGGASEDELLVRFFRPVIHLAPEPSRISAPPTILQFVAPLAIFVIVVLGTVAFAVTRLEQRRNSRVVVQQFRDFI